jgi:hypothetical protein
MNTSYRAEVTAESEKAICVSLNDDHAVHWIPRGQIQLGSQVHHAGESGLLIVSAWFAQTGRLPQGEITIGFEQRPNSGQLFKNRERKNDNAPNLTGTALLQLADGELVQLELAAWTRETRTGDKFLSLSIKPKGGRVGRQRFDDNHGAGPDRFNERVQEMSMPIDDDDISF